MRRHAQERAALYSATEVSDALAHLDRSRRRALYLREFWIYIVFLAIVCSVIFASRKVELQYNLGDALKALVLEETIDNQVPTSAERRRYRDVATETEYFEWLSGPLTEALFPASIGGQNVTEIDRLYLQRYNRLFGAVRLRQLRVDPEPCRHDLAVEEYDNDCWPDYSSATASTTAFPEDNPIFTYSTSEETGTFSWNSVTELILYDGDGFVTDVPVDSGRQGWLDAIALLRENRWIDLGTRAVFVSFNLYNASQERYVTVQLLAEFLAPGNIVVYDTKFRTIKVDVYVHAGDFLLMTLEAIFVLFVFYYVFRFGLETYRTVRILRNPDIRLQPGSNIFASVWYWLDALTLIMFLVLIGMHAIYVTDGFRRSMTDGKELDTNKYVNLEMLGSFQSAFGGLAAVAICLSFLKTFKYTAVNRRMSMVLVVLSDAWANLVIFLTMFLIVFVAFVVMGWIIFGPEMREFRAFGPAFSTLGRMTFGKFDYQRMSLTQPYIAPVYFYAFMVLLFFILMNMFLAILNDSYRVVTFEMGMRDEENNVLGKMSFWEEIKNSLLPFFPCLMRRQGKAQRRIASIMRLSEAEIADRIARAGVFKTSMARVTFEELQGAIGYDAREVTEFLRDYMDLVRAERRSHAQQDLPHSTSMILMDEDEAANEWEAAKRGSAKQVPAAHDLAGGLKSKANGTDAATFNFSSTQRNVLLRKLARLNGLPERIEAIRLIVESVKSGQYAHSDLIKVPQVAKRRLVRNGRENDDLW